MATKFLTPRSTHQRFWFSSKMSKLWLSSKAITTMMTKDHKRTRTVISHKHQNFTSDICEPKLSHGVFYTGSRPLLSHDNHFVDTQDGQPKTWFMYLTGLVETWLKKVNIITVPQRFENGALWIGSSACNDEAEHSFNKYNATIKALRVWFST